MKAESLSKICKGSINVSEILISKREITAIFFLLATYNLQLITYNLLLITTYQYVNQTNNTLPGCERWKDGERGKL